MNWKFQLLFQRLFYSLSFWLCSHLDIDCEMFSELEFKCDWIKKTALTETPRILSDVFSPLLLSFFSDHADCHFNECHCHQWSSARWVSRHWAVTVWGRLWPSRNFLLSLSAFGTLLSAQLSLSLGSFTASACCLTTLFKCSPGHGPQMWTLIHLQ